MTGVAIRPATAADAPAIGRIWREEWADGHEGKVPAALAAGRTPASFDRRAMERIGHTWVAEGGGTVAGFVVVVDAKVEQVCVDRHRRGGEWPSACCATPRRSSAGEARVPPGWQWWPATPARRFYAKWAGATGAPSPTRRRRQPARSQFPPTDTGARWATGENPLHPSRADQDQS
jgi:hypothetical protein